MGALMEGCVVINQCLQACYNHNINQEPNAGGDS